VVESLLRSVVRGWGSMDQGMLELRLDLVQRLGSYRCKQQARAGAVV
jgi:hypothetical protein